MTDYPKAKAALTPLMPTLNWEQHLELARNDQATRYVLEYIEWALNRGLRASAHTVYTSEQLERIDNTLEEFGEHVLRQEKFNIPIAKMMGNKINQFAFRLIRDNQDPEFMQAGGGASKDTLNEAVARGYNQCRADVEAFLRNAKPGWM